MSGPDDDFDGLDIERELRQCGICGADSGYAEICDDCEGGEG